MTGPGRRPVWRTIVLGAALAVAAANGAGAEESDRDPAYRRLNESFVERHVLPRYAQLADAAAALDAAGSRFCEAPATAAIDEVRSAFHAAADAWHGVEHLRFGPMESRLRAERLAFWPDPRNATGRQLGELLAGRDPAGLTPEGFLRASAAVQGLPAMEWLLFDAGAEAAFRKIDLARGRVLTTIEHARDRLLCGHGVYAGDGALLCATEEAGEEGRGVVGCYDPARGYRRVGEFPRHGIGPHEMTVLGEGRTLVVANGGYVTHPDAPGVKLDRDRMRPSLALLDARDGRLLEESRLPDPLHRLSLRHLAVGQGDAIAVAAQDEGDSGELAPLVAVWRGRAGLQLLDAGPSVTHRMRGYCGGAAVDPSGTLLAVSCPRCGLAVFWDLGTSRLVGTVDLPDGCGLAPGESPGTFLVTSGRGGVLRVEPREDRSTPLASSFVTQARWDNHLAVARIGATGSQR